MLIPSYPGLRAIMVRGGGTNTKKKPNPYFKYPNLYVILRIVPLLVRLWSELPVSPYKLSVFYKSDHPLITSVHGSWGNGPQVAMTTG